MSSARIFIAKNPRRSWRQQANQVTFSSICRKLKIKEGEKGSQIHKMAENKEIPSQYDLNAKWDACLDLGVRRFVYSSATGAFAGLLLFRSPVTRWASIAFGAGVGIGSAYSDCSQKFDGSNSTSPSIAKD